MRALLALCLALLPLPALAAREGPVAVMPFRNLNQDPELQWLEAGIAETLLSDLKRGAKVAVVERGQVDRVLAELSLQLDPKSEVTAAAKVGRLVGARTVVVGGFQKAGGALRITARFVDVETGVVEETAKATGPLREVFALQDEIAAALVGKPAKRRAKAAKRPARRRVSDKTIEAYRLYSLSLVADADAERARYLRDALALDPGFTYATFELEALEKRLSVYAKEADARFDERERELRAKIVDASAPEAERLASAKALLEALLRTRRYYTLFDESERIAALPLPQSPLLDVKELASFARVVSLARLRRVDHALQAGERHLKAFPAGDRYREVEALVRELVEEKREQARQRKEYDAELEQVRSELLTLQAEGGGADPSRELHLDYRPCIAAKWSKLPKEMIANCTRYLKKHGKRKDDEARDFALDARAFIAWGYALQGDFDKAREIAGRLSKDAPEQLGEVGLQKVMDERWPTDRPTDRPTEAAR